MKGNTPVTSHTYANFVKKHLLTVQPTNNMNVFILARNRKRLHTNENPYALFVACKYFTKKYIILYFIFERYRCHLCDRRTAQAGNLKSHYRHYHKIIVKSVSMYMDQSTIPFSQEIQQNSFERAHGLASYSLLDSTRQIEE